MINIIFNVSFYVAIGFVFYILLKRKCFFSLSVFGLYILYNLFIFVIVTFEDSIFWGVAATSMSLLFWSPLFLLLFVPALLFDFWRIKRINIQSDQPASNQQQRMLYLIIAIIILVVGIICFIGYLKFFGEKSSEKIDEDYFMNEIDNSSAKQNSSSEINPKDYSLLNYPLKESLIYNQLSDYCYKPEIEEEIIQKDTRLVKNNGEIIIPSIRQLIFASENKKPNCITEIVIFSTPTDGKYLYLTVSELSFKEHMSWPVYRLDLSKLSVERVLHVSVGGSIDTEEGFISNDNKLLPDGKRVVRWNEKDVFLVNLETDSSSIIYTALNNQWLVSNINPIDVVGKFLDTDVKVNGNKVTIGVYDQNQTFAKNPSGYQDYDINYVLVNRVIIEIPDNK